MTSNIAHQEPSGKADITGVRRGAEEASGEEASGERGKENFHNLSSNLSALLLCASAHSCSILSFQKWNIGHRTSDIRC